MTATPRLRRWLSLVATLAVFAGVVGLLACQRSVPGDADAGEKKPARLVALWGGSVQRNLVNLHDTNVLTDWAVPKNQKDTGKNIKWWA